MSYQPEMIFLDIDEVLADFIGAVLRVHGSDLTQEDIDSWNMEEALGVTVEEFWAKIDAAGVGFWANLALLPWANDLRYVCEQAAPEGVYLLSSPSWNSNSYAGKRRWVSAHFRDTKLILTSEKPLLASQGRLLIDDRPETCKLWRAAGGQALVFPRPWNGGSEADAWRFVVKLAKGDL